MEIQNGKQKTAFKGKKKDWYPAFSPVFLHALFVSSIGSKQWIYNNTKMRGKEKKKEREREDQGG